MALNLNFPAYFHKQLRTKGPITALSHNVHDWYLNYNIKMVSWVENCFWGNMLKKSFVFILKNYKFLNLPQQIQLFKFDILYCCVNHTIRHTFYDPLIAYFLNHLKVILNMHVKHFGKLLADSWTRTATTDIRILGFRATEIHPLKPASFPEHVFLSFEKILVDQQLINVHSLLLESNCPS